jgi:hypothetical protein
MVVPEDVHLIMENTTEIDADGETLKDALRELEGYRPRPLGSIVSRWTESGPIIMAAIVYDFSREPMARISDVFRALVNAFEAASRRRVQAMAVKPLGTRPAAITSYDGRLRVAKPH